MGKTPLDTVEIKIDLSEAKVIKKKTAVLLYKHAGKWGNIEVVKQHLAGGTDVKDKHEKILCVSRLQEGEITRKPLKFSASKVAMWMRRILKERLIWNVRL